MYSCEYFGNKPKFMVFFYPKLQNHLLHRNWQPNQEPTYAIANKTIPKYKNLDFLPDFKKCWFLLYYLPLFYMYMQLL